MAIELRQFGAQSATFLVTDGGATLRAAQWAELPAGKLKTLFSRVYTTGSGESLAVDNNAFAAACADAGFSVSSFRPATNDTNGVVVALNDSEEDGAIGEVEVVAAAGELGGNVIRLVTSYSASE